MVWLQLKSKPEMHTMRNWRYNDFFKAKNTPYYTLRVDTASVHVECTADICREHIPYDKQKTRDRLIVKGTMEVHSKPRQDTGTTL